MYPNFTNFAVAKGDHKKTGETMTLWYRGQYNYEITYGNETIYAQYSDIQTAKKRFKEVAEVWSILSSLEK